MPLVRPLRPTDSLPDLTRLLHRAYAPLGAMGLNYTAVDQAPEVTARRIQGGQCWVAEAGGKLIGTIVAQPTYDANECEYFTRTGVAAVHQFAVDPDAQGQGVGRSLLDACEAWARERGFSELAMDTAEQAGHLIELYAGLGYRPVGVVQWPGKVYRSVVLSKVLAPPAYVVSSDPSLLDVTAIHAFLVQAYWSPGIPLDTVERAVRHSVCVGAYLGLSQVGFARVVTDRATFAYVADVYVLEAHRRQGLSARMMEALTRHAELQGLRRWLLVTRDAHGLYERFGFKSLAAPTRFMEFHQPAAYAVAQPVSSA